MKSYKLCSIEDVATDMIRQARRGFWDGGMSQYLDACSATHMASRTRVIFLRQIQMYARGQMEDPQLERCLLLSLQTCNPDWLTTECAERWLSAFFGEAKRFLWVEKPAVVDRVTSEIWTFRLFVDENWLPLDPKSPQFRKLGWTPYRPVLFAHSTIDLPTKAVK